MEVGPSLQTRRVFFSHPQIRMQSVNNRSIGRAKYMMATTSTQVYFPNPSAASTATATTHSSMILEDFHTMFGSNVQLDPSGTSYRDMDSTITVYDPLSNNPVARYRCVNRIGPNGIIQDPVYICMWDAEHHPVTVVRVN